MKQQSQQFAHKMFGGIWQGNLRSADLQPEDLTPDSIYQQVGGPFGGNAYGGESESEIPPIPVPAGLPGGNTPVVNSRGTPVRGTGAPAFASGVIDTIPEDLGRRTTRDEAINALVSGQGTQVDDFTPAVGQVVRERFGAGDSLLGNLFNQRTDSFEDVFIGRGNVDATRGGDPLGFVRQTGLGGLGESAIENVRGYLGSADNFDFGNALENVIVAAGTVSGSHRRSVINRAASNSTVIHKRRTRGTERSRLVS